MNSPIQAKIPWTLHTLSTDNHLRTIPDIDHGADLYLKHQGRTLLNLASNNYLGLAGSDRLKQAAVKGVNSYGTSSSASRLISGNYHIYDQLEKGLCRFKKKPAALVTGSGYAANLCILGSLAGRKSIILSDRLNHASITDAALLSRARSVRYRHADMDHLEFLLKKNQGYPEKILITDTVFSMDGDTALLLDIVELCQKHQVLIAVDEAHATGIFGKGKGLAHHLGLEDEIQIHMGTFSKALGSYGGYIASESDIISLIINRARPFIFSTALPPAVVGASLAGLNSVMESPEKGRELLDMAGNLRSFLQDLGFDTGQSTTQIIPVILGSSSLVLQAHEKLIRSGIFAGAVRPPTVPSGTARLRLSLRTDMSPEEIEMVKQAFILLKKQLAL
ncbi:MAG: 8-amino-7-oxononanoate synthase [Desulfonatronovibrio sp.]